MTQGLGVGVDRGRGRGKLKNTHGLPLQLPTLGSHQVVSMSCYKDLVGFLPSMLVEQSFMMLGVVC